MTKWERSTARLALCIAVIGVLTYMAAEDVADRNFFSATIGALACLVYVGATLHLVKVRAGQCRCRACRDT